VRREQNGDSIETPERTFRCTEASEERKQINRWAWRQRGRHVGSDSFASGCGLDIPPETRVLSPWRHVETLSLIK
jgi:hypothetical protein